MKLYSFDIFDTCLVRFCGKPENLFEVLSYKVANKIAAKLSGNNVTEEHLRRLFVAARKECRGSLEQLYQRMSELFPIPCSPSDMALLELETEREMLVPVAETRELVNHLRTKGQIAFVSDMYLPTEFLRERLADLGFFCDGDHIYVSDDIGAWKHDGSLYKYVHEKEGIHYSQWHHYGDNRHSDVCVPRRLGIHAHLVAHDFLPYEKRWMKMPQALDHSTSIMAGVSRATRLSTNTDKDQKAFVADISAPLLCLWMDHVLQDAQQRKIEKLFFCARDTHSAYKVACKLKAVLPEYNNIYLTYFFVSQNTLAENSELATRYYKQIGLTPTDHVAIVDSRTRGWSLARLQASVTQGDSPAIMTYYWHLDTKECEWRKTLTKYPVDSFLHIAELSTIKESECASLEKITGLFENGLSLNFHRKTIGYTERPDGTIGPLFNSNSDEVSNRMPNIRKLKHDNDVLLETFAKGFAACSLNRFTNILIHTLLIPLLINFASQPRKKYLHYLNKIWILDVEHPFVNNIYNPCNRKGRWLFGSIVYSLPIPLDWLYCKLRYTKVGRKIRRIGYKMTKKMI